MHGRLGKKKKRRGKHSVVSQKVIHDLVYSERKRLKVEMVHAGLVLLQKHHSSRGVRALLLC